MEQVEAVVFDMDGVILDSGEIWERVMNELFADCQTVWDQMEDDDMAGGDNSLQWASYLRRVAGLPLEEQEIVDRVVAALLAAYETELPLLPGAVEAITRLAGRYPLGLASSSPRAVIAFVLERSGLDKYFKAWVSSDDVPRGKPAPDVYLKACAELGAEPERCVAVEDSRFGIRAAKAARLKVIAIPHRFAPLRPRELALADHTLASIDLLTPSAINNTLRAGEGAPRQPAESV